MKNIRAIIILCAVLFLFGGCSAGPMSGGSSGGSFTESPDADDADKYLTDVLCDGNDGSFSSLYTISYEDGAISGMVKKPFEDMVTDGICDVRNADYRVTNFRYNKQNVLFDMEFADPDNYTEYYDVALDGSYKAVKMRVITSFGDIREFEFFYHENGYLHSVQSVAVTSEEDMNTEKRNERSLVYTYKDEAIESVTYKRTDDTGVTVETVHSFYGPDIPNRGGVIHPDLDNGFYALGVLVYGKMTGKIPEKLHNRCVYETVLNGESETVNVYSTYEYDDDGYITGITRKTEYGDIYPEGSLKSAVSPSVDKYKYRYDYSD